MVGYVLVWLIRTLRTFGYSFKRRARNTVLQVLQNCSATKRSIALINQTISFRVLRNPAFVTGYYSYFPFGRRWQDRRRYLPDPSHTAGIAATLPMRHGDTAENLTWVVDADAMSGGKKTLNKIMFSIPYVLILSFGHSIINYHTRPRSFQPSSVVSTGHSTLGRCHSNSIFRAARFCLQLNRTCWEWIYCLSFGSCFSLSPVIRADWLVGRLRSLLWK